MSRIPARGTLNFPIRLANLIGAAGFLGLALGSATLATAADTAPKVVATVPQVVLPQLRVDRLDVSAWPKVKVLATALDGRGAPVELKHLVKLDVLDGSKKATVASKNNPALVSFEKGVALGNRKDAKMLPRAEAEVGLDLVLVVQGYASTVEPLMQQRIRDAVAAAFKPLGKGDRVNLVWYNDRVYQATGLRNLDSRLVDIESKEFLSKCQDARREARSGGAITLGPPPGKETPPIEPGTDLCGLQSDAGKVASLAKNQPFAGAFPRPFNLGPPFWDVGRYCGTPGGALDGFGTFGKEEYERNKQEREDAKLKGLPVDFEHSAVDRALELLLRDGKEGSHKAIVLLSDGRDGWVWDLSTCADHPPPPCNAFDASAQANVDRLAAMNDRQQMIERHRLAVDLRRCIEREQVLTKRVALMQTVFHDKAQQWIGMARAAGVRFYAVGIRRPGVVTSPYDLDRLRLLAEKTGGTYREVGDSQPAIGAVSRTMTEVTGQLAIEFTHQSPDDVEERFSVRLSATLDAKLDHPENPGTQMSSEAVIAALPLHASLGQQLKEVGWGLLVRIQMLIGYEVYVIIGWVMAVGAILLATLILVALVRKLLRRKPKPAA